MKDFVLYHEKRNMVRPAAWLILLCLLLALGGCRKDGDIDPVLRFCFLDVGQGDCTLLRTQEGDILIDAGPEYAQDRLCARLRAMGVKRLALAIFTHLDEDHIGGADGVLQSFEVGEVWINGGEETHESANALYGAIQENGASLRIVRAGDKMDLGGVRLMVLAPMTSTVQDGNEGSLVIRVNCGKVAALFTGDVGEKMEKALVSAYGAAQLSCQLYKAGHHGSYTSGSKDFLAAVSPEYAVVSSGVGNSFGHPHGTALERLEAAGATVYRTDLFGDIFFVTDGERLVYEER